ncbi:MAG: hypothetical protein K1X89_18395 [Myxococcaceae bacterium]|nr:hypothetical protein [Myxococcaceae bacterium]
MGRVDAVGVVRPVVEADALPEVHRERRAAENRDTLEPYVDPGPGALARSGLGLSLSYRDAQVQVVSDVQLSEREAKALATRVERAYAFDAAIHGWSKDDDLAPRLTVAVLGQRGFQALSGDTSGAVGGFTTGPSLFVVPEEVARQRRSDDDVTIAHELGHVQDYRQAGKRLAAVPMYLQEGKAYLLGDLEPMARGQGSASARNVVATWERMSARDAQWVVQRFRTARDEALSGRNGYVGEVGGALFVEFLRTQFHGGHADVLKRLGTVVADVGAGQSYGAAFGRQFGGSPDAAEAAFVAWVKSTEDDPARRLDGSVLESLA